MNEPVLGSAERFVRAILLENENGLDDVNENDVRPLASAVAACSVALARVWTTPSEVSRAAAEATLQDSEGNKIPTWVVEAVLRAALGEPRMLEGLSASLVVDTQLAFIRSALDQTPAAERRDLAEVATAIVNESLTPGG